MSNFSQRREIFIKVQEAETPKEEVHASEQLVFEFMCLDRHAFVMGESGQLQCVRCGLKLQRR